MECDSWGNGSLRGFAIGTILNGVVLNAMPAITSLLATATLSALSKPEQTSHNWVRLFIGFATKSGLDRGQKIAEVLREFFKNLGMTPPDLSSEIMKRYDALDAQLSQSPAYLAQKKVPGMLNWLQNLSQAGAIVFTTSVASTDTVDGQVAAYPELADSGLLFLGQDPTNLLKTKPHFAYVSKKFETKKSILICDAGSEVRLARKNKIASIGIGLKNTHDYFLGMANAGLACSGSHLKFLSLADISGIDPDIFTDDLREAGPDRLVIYRGAESVVELNRVLKNLMETT